MAYPEWLAAIEEIEAYCQSMRGAYLAGDLIGKHLALDGIQVALSRLHTAVALSAIAALRQRRGLSDGEHGGEHGGMAHPRRASA
jgi:hypothetical protein